MASATSARNVRRILPNVINIGYLTVTKLVNFYVPSCTLIVEKPRQYTVKKPSETTSNGTPMKPKDCKCGVSDVDVILCNPASVDKWHFVKCFHCRKTVFGKTRAEAIKAWNKDE